MAVSLVHVDGIHIPKKKIELPFVPDVPIRDNSKYCDREFSDREGQEEMI